MKRYITKYTENGKLYAEAWDQINIFGKAYTFHRRRIEIPVKHGRWITSTSVINNGTKSQAKVYTQCKCSVCGGVFGRMSDLFCYHCGARMDGENDEID